MSGTEGIPAIHSGEDVKLREMDSRVTYRQQLQEDDGHVVLINQFNVAPGDTAHFLQV